MLAFSNALLATVVFAAVMLTAANAAVLPEDRVDVLYHSYSGDGVEVTGPSILVRKSLGTSSSFSANYYVDEVSSASVDVVSQGSEYTEERKEGSLGADFLYEDTIFSVGAGNSEENDYSASSYWFGLTQEFFGGLSTVSFGYARASDEVRKNGTPSFSEDINRRNYRLGLTQVLTKNSIVGITFETITDEGYLNNPYRSYRFLDPTSGTGYSYALEKYPSTRTSSAVALRGRYFLQPHSAVYAEYRYFSDDWDIEAQNIEVGYARALNEHWLVEVGYRYYTQTGADFFGNIFARKDEQNFMGRDKELSPFDNQTISIGVTYEFLPNGWWALDSGSVNLFYDYIMFNYDEYTNNSPGTTLATEQLYQFDANVIRAFLSVEF